MVGFFLPTKLLNLLGKEGEYKFTNTDKIEMEWIFVRIGELLPIYEDIEDGVDFTTYTVRCVWVYLVCIY